MRQTNTWKGATLQAWLMAIALGAAVGCGKTTNPAKTSTTKQTTPAKARDSEAAKRVLFSNRAAAEAAFSRILGAKFSPTVRNPEIRQADDEAKSCCCFTYGDGESIDKVFIIFDRSDVRNATSLNARKSQQMALDICDVIEDEMMYVKTDNAKYGLPVHEPQSLRNWFTIIAMPGLEEVRSKLTAELPSVFSETRMNVTLPRKFGIHADCVIPDPGNYQGQRTLSPLSVKDVE